MATIHDPSRLPDIDAVEVVSLSGMDILKETNYLEYANTRPHARIDGSKAQEIAELWRHLPFAGQARCHNPPLVVRFIASGRKVLEGSVCWGCNNIWGMNEDGGILAQFDGESPAAKELYRILCAAIEHLVVKPSPQPFDPVAAAVRRAAQQAEKLESDRKFYYALSPERTDETCQHADCNRGAIKFSIYCRAHHFEMIRGYSVQFET